MGILLYQRKPTVVLFNDTRILTPFLITNNSKMLNEHEENEIEMFTLHSMMPNKKTFYELIIRHLSYLVNKHWHTLYTSVVLYSIFCLDITATFEKRD